MSFDREHERMRMLHINGIKPFLYDAGRVYFSFPESRPNYGDNSPFGHLIRPAKTVADAAPHEAGGSYRTRLSRMADPKSPGEGDWLSGLIITRRNERWKNSKKILYKNCY